MKKITLYVKDHTPVKVEIDNQFYPIEAFFLTTSVTEKECGHFLCFGNSEVVGKMLYNFYLYCIKESIPEMGHVMEAVSQDILDAAKNGRGTEIGPSILSH